MVIERYLIGDQPERAPLERDFPFQFMLMTSGGAAAAEDASLDGSQKEGSSSVRFVSSVISSSLVVVVHEERWKNGNCFTRVWRILQECNWE